MEIYFRILLVLGFDCFILSALLLVDPQDVAIANPQMSRGTGVYVWGFVLLAPALILLRRAYDWVVSRRAFRERVYVLGAGDYARSTVESIRSRPDLGMEVLDWEDIQLEPAERKQIWIRKLDKLAHSTPPVRRVIIEDDSTLRERLYGKIQLDGLRPSNFLYSEGFRLRASQQFIRQVVSILAAALGLLIFLPAFPFVVLAVKLSSKGPVFFRQKRVGMGGRVFDVLKFRTMFTDAEAGGAKWATKNDPRVTTVVMFLRKTRIDEIPQLWNVLRGDMGFVGPRPERPE